MYETNVLLALKKKLVWQKEKRGLKSECLIFPFFANIFLAAGVMNDNNCCEKYRKISEVTSKHIAL